MMRRLLSFGSAVLLVAAASACGGGDDGPAAPSGNTISMGATSFVPTALTIDASESVTFRNPSGIVHNVTFTTVGSPANIPDHGSGQTSRTFASAGTFAFTCTNHAGMNGTITVQ